MEPACLPPRLQAWGLGVSPEASFAQGVGLLSIAGARGDKRQNYPPWRLPEQG